MSDVVDPPVSRSRSAARLLGHLVALLVGVIALSACRVDVDTSIVIEPDGTGVVTVHAVADADLVQRVPDLADDLRLDDAIANGWVVDGPTPTDDGGLEITLTHPVSADPQDWANALASIGPPFSGVAAGRLSEENLTTNQISGSLVLPDGFASFADTELIAAAGGVPFADDFAETQATPPTSMSFTFVADLPGEIVTSPTGDEAGGVVVWEAPLDGSTLNFDLQTVQKPADEGSTWARPLADATLVALVAWVAIAVAFIVFVMLARRRKRRRRRRPSARPAQQEQPTPHPSERS